MHTNHLLKTYKQYKENRLVYRHFQPAAFYEILQTIPQKKLELTQLGVSAENRSIYTLKFGEGKTSVLLWSQMHGNEPTATMALLDIFHFLENPKDEVAMHLVNKLSQELTLYFVPVLNPDGTARYTRRTAQGIDMNRDFLSPQTPEAKLLIDFAAKIQPQFSFNLHDQRSKYSVGSNPIPTALAFLAPAFDEARTVKGKRRFEAMQLISLMVESLQKEVGTRMAKYSDEFEPRAFGDNFQKLGYGTILIESGHYPHDWEKQEVRKYNFVAILNALAYLAENNFQTQSIEAYENLPFNGERFYDLILRNVELAFSPDLNFKVDIAFERHSKFNQQQNKYEFDSKIADLGDLSTFYGHEEHDCNNAKLIFKEGEIDVDKNPTLVFERKENNSQQKFIVSNGVFKMI